MNDQTPMPPAADQASEPPVAADVLHDGRVGADDEELILAALAACGVAARVRVVPARRDVQALTWLLLISLPLQAFLSVIGAKIADDAYGTFVRAARRLLGRRQPAGAPAAGSPPVLVLQDPLTGVRIVVAPDLPDEAWEQLPALDLSGYRSGSFSYDRPSRRWRSEVDEEDTAHARS